jgi:hypothetical protein
MRPTCLFALVSLAACTATNPLAGKGSGSDGGGSISTSSSVLNFGVFGDCRPDSPGNNKGYPVTVLSNIFSLMQQKQVQFALGTGDYMFADTQADVDAQMASYEQSQAHYTLGPVYHVMGNHECTGATASNCPNGDETPNVRAFMSKLVPSGTRAPYYRVDVDTPHGKAKFLFIAANAWSSAQSTWLEQQLADATHYTFVIRHEPAGTDAPGVAPSEQLVRGASYTLQLMGHYHEYRRYDAKHVISGNGGAPPPTRGSQTAGFGWLWVQQLDDGNLALTEIDETSGNPIDTWKIDPAGNEM